MIKTHGLRAATIPLRSWRALVTKRERWIKENPQDRPTNTDNSIEDFSTNLSSIKYKLQRCPIIGVELPENFQPSRQLALYVHVSFSHVSDQVDREFKDEHTAPPFTADSHFP